MNSNREDMENSDTEHHNTKQLRIYVWGEPGDPYMNADVVISSAIPKNNAPEKIFYNNIMISMWPWNRSFNDIASRPIDVYFRSSNCAEKREESVGIIRKIIEENGFNFTLGGACGGKGYSLNSNTDPGSWGSDCERCRQSKIILSIDNYNNNNLYLSEKFFIPLAYGAIPAYIGNGQSFIEWNEINKECYLDRINYESDEAFAYAIVDVLKNQQKLEYMQQQKRGNSDKLSFWYNGPLTIGDKGSPELIKYMRTHFDFSHKDIITYYVDYHHMDDRHLFLGEFLTVVFNKPAKKIDQSPNADVIFTFCC